MKYFSMFSGSGGFERGIEQSWNARSAGKKEVPTQEEGSVKNVLLNTQQNGEKTTPLDTTLGQGEKQKLEKTETTIQEVSNVSATTVTSR